MNHTEPSTKNRLPAHFEGFITVAILPLWIILGMLWGGVALPETSRQVLGTVLNADLARTAFNAVLLAACLARIFWWKRRTIWRGAALALAAASGEGVVGGLTLALTRTLSWSVLTNWVVPLATLVYALTLAWVLRRHLAERKLPWRAMQLCAALGLLAAAWWPAAGAFGTLSELLVAGIEAAGISLIGASCLWLLFLYDQTLTEHNPVWAGLLGGAVCAAALMPAFAVRGWSAQSLLIAMAAVFFSLASASLVVTSRPFQPGRDFWKAWAFLCAALLPPLVFTNGEEGDWLPGGLPPEANTALLISVITCLFLVVLVFLVGGRVQRWKIYPMWRFALPVCALAFSLSLLGWFDIAYGFVGLQADTFFVVMAEQPDTGFARQMTDPVLQRAAVYQTLVQQAQSSQTSIRVYLDAQGVAYTPYYLVNGLEVQGNPVLRQLLAHRADVARILNSPHLRPQHLTTGKLVLAEERPTPSQLPWGITAIGADRVWDASGKIIDGSGIVVGSISTGVDWTHPDLNSSYLGGEGRHDYAWYDPWEGTTAPVDTNGIGTHTLATVVGARGTGVAPGARWIACRSLARDLGNPPLYLSCMQFMLAPFPQHGSAFRDGDPARGVNIIDAAWICPSWEGCDAGTLSIAIRHIADAGQMFVTGAGNDGPSCGTIVSPGLSSDALTVGAMGKDGLVARSSSRGPISADGSGRSKPDLLAPGVGIISDLPGGRYAEFNGTSMAASHVAGAVALLWAANPTLIGQVEQTRQILLQTAHRQPTPGACGASSAGQHNDDDYGLVDAYAAVLRAMGR